MKRVEEELALLRRDFPAAGLSEVGDWVEIPEYPLPPGLYNREATRVRMPLSPAYPDVAPDNFYVVAGLRLRSGAALDNYGEISRFGELWGQFSWHPKRWTAAARPEQGDNMSTFFNTIRKRFEEGR